MNKIIDGLRKLPLDTRDFSFGAIFGKPKEPLPDEFILETLGVKDQKGTDFCAAFSSTTLSELQEGVILEPSYVFAKAKELAGEWQSWGLDLRQICKAWVSFGCIPKLNSPFNVETKDRDFLANWQNWPKELDFFAFKHAKRSFFSVSGTNPFQAIKEAIWLNRDKAVGVLTGALFRESWQSSETGIIPNYYESEGSGHAFAFIGWKKIDGIEYLVAQNSYGEEVGDNGKFYFSKEVVERECTFGNYCFIDLPKEDAKVLTSLNLSIKYRWVATIWNKIKYIFS